MVIIDVIVETPKGSRKKYELTKSGKLVVDQLMKPGFEWPGNYGFVPETVGGDGDNLDVFIISRNSLKSKSKTKAKVIGIMLMNDSGERDDKIIAVPLRSRIRNLKDISPKMLDKISYFFKHYKKKNVKVYGFEGIEKAKKVIVQAKNRYKG